MLKHNSICILNTICELHGRLGDEDDSFSRAAKAIITESHQIIPDGPGAEILKTVFHSQSEIWSFLIIDEKNSESYSLYHVFQVNFRQIKRSSFSGFEVFNPTTIGGCHENRSVRFEV